MARTTRHWRRVRSKRLRRLVNMKRDFAGAHVPRVDFERLRPSCQFDSSFPETYEAWSQLVAEGEALAEQTGSARDPIVVDVDEFERWCATAAVRPCLPAMRAFLIVKRYGLSRAVDGDL